MKPGYLGDCPDFYKRWFLTEFFPGEQLVAVPMVTESWGPMRTSDTYSKLLGVKVIQEALFPNLPPDAAQRAEYLRPAIAGEFASRDVFLDPDTGLCLDRRPPGDGRYDAYVFASELQRLLPAGSLRAAIVYDHSISRNESLAYARRKVERMRELDLFAFAYCAQVAMVVISRQEARIAGLYDSASRLAYLPQDRLACNPAVKP